MQGQDFLLLANSLAAGTTEVEWRSAVSRAYYGAFHVARGLLLHCQFAVPRDEQAHAYLWLRLSNASQAGVRGAGSNLGALRRNRNWADYDLGTVLDQTTATNQVQVAENIVRVLEAAALEPVKTQITDAMKVYERDILKTVTWHP